MCGRVAAVWLLAGVVLGCVLVAQSVDLPNRFEDSGLGYTIDYPSGWSYTKPRSYSVTFSGAYGTPAGEASVTIENLLSTAAGGQYGTAPSVINAYKCELVTESGEVCISTSQYPNGDGYVAQFVYQGVSLKEWRIVVARADGSVFHAWAYIAPAARFETYLPIAQAMLASWRLSGAGESTPKPSPATSGSIRVLLEVTDRIGRLSTCNSDSDLSLGRCDRRVYSVTVASAGYLACGLVDEAGQWIGARVTDAAGEQVAIKPGNFAEAYTGAHAVEPGIYTVTVGPELFTSESAFELQVYFSTQAFTVEDLEAQFGDRTRVLVR